MKRLLVGLGVMVVLVGLAGCRAAIGTPTPASQPEDAITGEAMVEQLEIRILESFPVQVHVAARGNLPDGCTQIDTAAIRQERDGNTFRVTLPTVRPADQMCTEALVPFEEVIPLDVVNLPAGTYTVVVNGVESSFELDMDNTLPAE